MRSAGARVRPLFSTPFYASGEQWQAETVAALDRRGVRWVLWRGPTEYWNAPDFIPNCVRQWKIASYLVAHYRPVRVLPGNSVLLERNGGVQAGVAALGRELWLTAAEVTSTRCRRFGAGSGTACRRRPPAGSVGRSRWMIFRVRGQWIYRRRRPRRPRCGSGCRGPWPAVSSCSGSIAPAPRRRRSGWTCRRISAGRIA